MKKKLKTTLRLLTCVIGLNACGAGQSEQDASKPVPTTAPTEPASAPAKAEAPAAPAPQVEPNGTVIEVNMYTRDPEDPKGLQVFKSDLVRAKVGDTIRFVPTNPSHQSVSIEGMLPEGVKGWEGKLNQEVSFVVPKPGVYGYKCTPHYAAGMVGLIVVEGEGMEANVEAAKAVSHPGLARKAFEQVFAEAGL